MECNLLASTISSCNGASLNALALGWREQLGMADRPFHATIRFCALIFTGFFSLLAHAPRS